MSIYDLGFGPDLQREIGDSSSATVYDIFGDLNPAQMSTGATIFSGSGEIIAKDISIGGNTTQYQISNAGLLSFGDGSDGLGTFNGTLTPTGSSKVGSAYSLTRDVYYTDMVVSTVCTVNPSGFRIFAGSLTLAGTGKIFRNGNAGTQGGHLLPNGTGGAGGAALADGYLKGSLVGGTGGGGNAGSPTSPTNGTGGSFGNGNTQNSIGSNGVAGGNGIAVATATASNVKLIANWHLATLLDVSSSGSTVKFDNSAASGGGGAGSNSGGEINAGGGGGSAGGIIAIYARNIVIGADASITTNGGVGGAGADGANPHNQFGGSGGGGGNGGQIILVYNTLTNNGTLQANGGLGGAAGNGNSPGVSGSNGNGGNTRLFQISL